MKNVFRTFFGRRPFEFDDLCWHMKIDEKSVSQEYHADEQIIGHKRGISIIVNVLRPISANDGAPNFLLGSFKAWESKESAEYKLWSPTMDIGDVLVFRDDLIHAGSVANSLRSILFLHAHDTNFQGHSQWVDLVTNHNIKVVEQN